MSRRNDNSGELADVRHEIDAIDDAILDLLKRRFRAVARVKQIKGLEGGGGGAALRPAREAQVLRRLVAASGGEVPVRLVAKMWFELMAAATRFQAPISIHLPASPVRLELQDLVRFHAGAELRVVEHETPEDALTAVAKSQGDIMFCPLGDGNQVLGAIERRCILSLLNAGSDVRISARLPFVAGTGDVSVLVVGKAPYEPSGDDTTVLAVRSTVPGADLLGEKSFEDVSEQALYSTGDGPDPWGLYHLSGFVSADDDRVSALRGDSRCLDVRHMGGFANPIERGNAT